jgi:hypothetical protein
MWEWNMQVHGMPQQISPSVCIHQYQELLAEQSSTCSVPGVKASDEATHQHQQQDTAQTMLVAGIYRQQAYQGF